VAHRRANLEHAAASVVNMIQTAILILLLAWVVLALSGPDVTIGHVHPMTPILFLTAGAGFWLVYRSRQEPMWRPRLTTATVEDKPDAEYLTAPLAKLFGAFAVYAVLIAASGALVAHSAGNLADQTLLNETVAGALLSGIATSLPELVTTVAAVRRGALTLAVSDIVGGNFFDVLFVFAADLVYRAGSLYHAPGVGARELFLVGLAITLNAVLLIGLLFRQREGPANVGFETVFMIVIYIGGLIVVTLAW
jgi:cation:H+ antiporter